MLALLRCYCKSRRWAALLAAVCALAILTVYWLYYLEPGPALYTLLVLLVILLTAAALDFSRYRRRMLELRRLERLADLCAGGLPPTEDPLQAQYLAVTAAVERRSRRELARTRAAAARAGTYYTLWSHQVKTPLAALGLLLRDREPDTAAMERELLKMEQYVDMALQFQRLEAVENDLAFRRCDAGALVRRTLRRTSPLLIGKGLKVELGDLGRLVLTDEKWLGFVLEQLLTNAAKYTPAGGTVRLYFRPGDVLVVEDTGIGIPPEDLPRIFEWGYTGAAGRLAQRSTGIGLALCRRTMEMLGHGISAESRPGQGTWILLDLSRAALGLE